MTLPGWLRKLMGKDNDDFDRDDLAPLVTAINALTKVHRDDLEFRKTELATRDDLDHAEKRIIKAIGERVDPEAVRQLDKSTDGLEAAIEANKPKISG